MWTQWRKLGILVLFSAVSCLGSPEADAWQILHAGVNDGNAARRAQAVSALGMLGSDAEAARLAEAALEDNSPEVRQAAAAALSEMQCRESIPKLKLALNDKNDQVSIAAAKALANMGDMSGRDVFRRLLAGEIRQRPGMIQSAMDEARAKMRDPATIARFGASGAAAATATPFGAPAGLGIWLIKNALTDKGVQGRITALNYLVDDPSPYAETLLEWALADSNWEVRATAIKGLGERGDPAAIPKLEPLFKDGRTDVRCLAAAAVVRLSEKTLPS